MTPDPLGVLMEKLASGDTATAEQMFRAYVPYLRRVVERRLTPAQRAKFDSEDVVQSVWLHLLEGLRGPARQWAGPGHMRGFLAQLARHRYIDHLRRHRRAIEREQPLAEGGSVNLLPAAGPQPQDLISADELWEQLLELCPPQHREVLRLKRGGTSTAEIADRTGLNAGSVRRILGDLSKRLAALRAQELSG